MMFTRAARTMLALMLLAACESPAPTPAPPPQPPPEPAVVAPAPPRLVASTHRTCLMRERDTVCWGTHPQNGPISDSSHLAGWYSYPTEGAAQILIGATFLCALYPSGEVRCARQFETLAGEEQFSFSSKWGQRVSHTGLRPLAGLRDTVALAAGDSHVCALDKAGLVRCWGKLPHRLEGWDDFGLSVTDPRLAEVPAPEELERLSNSRALAASPTGTCVIHNDSSVHCLWAKRRRRSPGEQRHALDATTIAMNNQAVCAVRANGTVSCFGPERKDSYQVDGLHDAVSIVGMVDGFCARRRSGKVACWQILYREPGPFIANVNLTVVGLDAIEAIALGYYHLCALNRAGQVSCLGRNDFFQLAQPMVTPRDRQARTRVIHWLEGATGLFADAWSVCAKRTESLLCLNQRGLVKTYPKRVTMLQDGISINTDGKQTRWSTTPGPPPASPGALPTLMMLGTPDEPLPFRVAYMSGENQMLRDKQGQWWLKLGEDYIKGTAWSSVTAASYRRLVGTCVLKKDRTLRCYDIGDLTKLEPDKDNSAPVLTDVVHAEHGCGLTAAGQLGCFHRLRAQPSSRDADYASADDELVYDQGFSSKPTFQSIPEMPTNIASFHGSGTGGCAVTTAGEVYCWLDGYRTKHITDLQGAIEVAQAAFVLPPLRCGRFPSGEVKCNGRSPGLFIEIEAMPIVIPDPLPAPTKIPRFAGAR